MRHFTGEPACSGGRARSPAGDRALTNIAARIDALVELRLGRTLDMPLRDRNALLEPAGFESMFKQLEPHPTVAMDRHWNILAGNQAHRVLLTTIGTAQDITLQELRLASFFPADEASDRVLRALLE